MTDPVAIIGDEPHRAEEALTQRSAARTIGPERRRGMRAGGSRKSGTTSSCAFQYDYAGRRIRRIGPEGASGCLWGDGELLEESASDGGRVLYERGAGMAFGVSRFAAGGAVAGRERLMHDGLDSVVGRVGTSGVPVLYRYDAWGGFSTGTQPAGSDPSLAYAGQHWDAGLGLSYAQQRWYEPGTGRFLSEDPVFGDVERPDSLHAFGYAGGNPARFVDPSGEQSTCTGPQSANPMNVALCSGRPEAVEALLQRRAAEAAARKTAEELARQQAIAHAEAAAEAAAEAKAAAETQAAINATRPWWGRLAAAAGLTIGAGSNITAPYLEAAKVERERQWMNELSRRECAAGNAGACEVVHERILSGQDNGPPMWMPGAGGPEKRAPGADNDAGKVVTDPTTGLPMAAPGTGGAPMAAPGADRGGAAVLVSGDIWTPGKVKDPEKNAAAHWKKHAAEFPEFKDKEEYIEGARAFLNTPPASALTKTRPLTGEVVVYDPVTNTFGIRCADGTPATMFRPDPAKHGYPTNLDYFHAQ